MLTNINVISFLEDLGIPTLFVSVNLAISIEQHEFHKNPEVNSGAPEWQDIPAPLVVSIVLLLLQTRYKS